VLTALAPALAGADDIRQDGEIAVIRTDDPNPMLVTRTFYSLFGDDFDTLCLFKVATEDGDPSYTAVRSDVRGIGAPAVDDGIWWGSAARLSGVIDMRNIGRWGGGMDDPGNAIHPVAAQEFAHRWGAFVLYVDKDGHLSDALLGAEAAHWAGTVHAHGSVLDGSEWIELSPRNFWLKGRAYRFSELDQYLMGLRGPDEVSDFFRIRQPTWQGHVIGAQWPLPAGLTIQGEREDISIEQIIAAHGPRVPDHNASPRAFRLGVVLVAGTQESTAAVADAVTRLEGFRKGFELALFQMSDTRMEVCTRLSDGCDGFAPLPLPEPEVEVERVVTPPGTGCSSSDSGIPAAAGHALGLLALLMVCRRRRPGV